jgi:two-component system sensor histidine kinase ArlS
MPVRLRITFLFTILVMVVLFLVCGSIYYFSWLERTDMIRTRLTNRAKTTARLLAQKESFDQGLVRRIDSLTTISLVNKSVQAYNYQNEQVYKYSDNPGDSIPVTAKLLDNARVSGSYFFRSGNKEAVAYHYTDMNSRMVVISAAEDVDGIRNLRNLLNILTLSYTIAISIILVTGYFFSKSLLRPVKRITDDVTEISAQNLARRIKTNNSKDEWNALSRTLNDLLDRLQESFEMQRRFISNASHELSTPLTSISSQIEVALQRDRDNSAYRDVLASVLQDVKQMSKLTQTLLDFAKASGDQGGLEITAIRMDEVLMGLPLAVSKLDPSYGVQIKFEQPPENEKDLLVFGNETLISTALINIISNGCKYSPDHTTIVDLFTTRGQIKIVITDNGRGIPEEEQRNIFQPFYRVDNNSSTKGYGLGLSLAEKIIRLHRGNIEVHSSKDGGTQFIILFPSVPATLV